MLSTASISLTQGHNQTENEKMAGHMPGKQ